MKKRQIGSSALYASEIGLGCMSLGTDRNNASRILDVAIANGVNFIDTADLYDQGLNEELVGSLIKSRRNELIVATKVGNRFERGEEGWEWDPSKKHIKSAVKESLQRLQLDHIDLYQLHGGTVEDRIDETIEAFEELKVEGLIRYYGLSSIRPNVIAAYLKRSNIVSVMMQYSLIDQRPEELFPLLAEKKVSVLARGSLAKGFLSNTPPSKRKKGYFSYSNEEVTSIWNELTLKLPGRTVLSAALKYCLSAPVIGSIIVGASSEQQFIETLDAYASPSLSKGEVDLVRSIVKPTFYKEHRI